MAAVDQYGQLNSLGPPVVEQGFDRRPDRAPRVENVVHQDAGLSLEREVERRRPHDRLRMERRLAASHLHVVAIEGDVDHAEIDDVTGALGNQRAQPLGDRNAAGLNAYERETLEVVGLLDQFVRDARDRAIDRLGVENDLSRRAAGGIQSRYRVAGLITAG